MCFDSRDNILEKMKKVVETMKIRECLEYLRQAAQNPTFNNDYSLDFEDILTSLSTSQSEDKPESSPITPQNEEEESEWVALSDEIDIEANIIVIGNNIFKKNKASEKEEFLIN